MTEHQKKNLLNGNSVAPWKILSIQNIIVLAAVFAVLVGMLYLFEAQNSELSQDRDIETRQASLLANNTKDIKDNQTQAISLLEQSLENQRVQIELLTEQLQRGNIFRNNTAITTQNNTSMILEKLESLTTELDTRKDEHTEQTALLEQGLLRTGNATAQRQGVAAIFENQKAIEEIDKKLTSLIEDLKGNPYLY